MSSVHSNPSVGKRLSQLESAPNFPHLNAPRDRLPSPPASICSVLPPPVPAPRRDSPTDDVTDEFILHKTRPSHLDRTPKKPSVKPSLSFQQKASFPPVNPTDDKKRGQKSRLPVLRHHSVCLPSEKSTVGIPAPVFRPEVRHSGHFRDVPSFKPVYPPKGPRMSRQNLPQNFASSMPPSNEQHVWVWNFVGDERTGRVAEKVSLVIHYWKLLTTRVL